MIEQSPDPEQTYRRDLSTVAVNVITLLQHPDTVAYIIGLKQGRTIKSWVRNEVVPHDPLMERRLLLTESLASKVADSVRPWVSGAWLIANNPHLQEYAPSDLIQSLSGTEADRELFEQLHHAADKFIA